MLKLKKNRNECNLTFRPLFGFEPKIWKFNKQRSIHGFDHAVSCCEMWWSGDEINYTYPGCGCGKFVCVHQFSISFALYLNGFNLISRTNIKYFPSTIKNPRICNSDTMCLLDGNNGIFRYLVQNAIKQKPPVSDFIILFY